MKFFGVIAVAATLAAAALPASAQTFMPLGGLSSQPIGHYDFCQRYAEECGPIQAHRPVELTRQLWDEIVRVNNHVNTTIVEMTDLEAWGQEEYWEYPIHGMGDCEDLALEKRRLLNEAGIPLSNLPITVLRERNGNGHAVLTVNTSMGDFILDNLEPRVLPWSETDYEFLKRQAPNHAGQWVAIEDDRDLLVGSVDAR